MADVTRTGTDIAQVPLSPIAKYAKSIYALQVLRKSLLTWVMNSYAHVAQFQKICGVESNQYQKYPIIHHAFKLGAALGDELFYLIFLSSLSWCYDGMIARRVILLWLNIYYVGQSVKDMLELPRPSSPPVVHLEHHYITEYGLPSTHAMAAISMPMYILHLAPAAHFEILLPLAISWFVLMTLSRVYLGVHSLPDIYVGLVLGFNVLCFHACFGEVIDNFVLHSVCAPLTVLSFGLFLILIYPAPEKWTTAFGDTTLIIGVACGVCFANWIQFFILGQPKLMIQSDLTLLLSRVFVGLIILILTRTVVKKAMLVLMKNLVGYENVNDALRTYKIEIPTKFMTYGTIGFNAIFIVPRVFIFLEI